MRLKPKAPDVAAASGAAPTTVSLLGGDEGRAKTSTSGAAAKKMTPGEIRVQKGEALLQTPSPPTPSYTLEVFHRTDISELDAGKVGSVEWPDRTDLTSMVLTIKPEQVSTAMGQ